ncbi:CDP-glycerol glycerophosphotransferase family protein [uncultured Methanobrevibacter sp.]|uniref:bifunctional glycosyltransferase/CDP-glycerol:glycerophosphate glycerophosphotransferase n=1 Tax=uncultured Methanobrevibacter sp. TaxID=253161 RepID=UPI0026100EB4
MEKGINEENTIDFKFSVVMAIYNSEDFLKEAIDSVINQSIGFEENIQLILVNDGSEDSSYEICLKYQDKFPKNIIALSQENAGQASARNHGLKHIKGKYINFLDSDDYFAEDAFEKVFDFFEKHYEQTDIVSIPIYFFGRERNQHILNGKFTQSRVIDLTEEPNNIQLHTNSSFIKKEYFKEFNFPTNVIFSEDVILVNKILLIKKTLGVLNTTQYYLRKRFDENSTIDTVVFKKEYYNEKLSNYFLYLINYAKEKEGEIPEFLLYALAYDLQWIFEQAELSILDEDEREDFFKYLREILDYIPSHMILNNQYIKNPFRRDYFLYMKENDLHTEINENNNVLLKVNDFTIDNIQNHRIWFDIIEFDGDYLNMSGLFNSLYDIKNISIEAIKESENLKTERYIGEYARYTSRRDIKFFSETFQFRNNFDIRIPIKENEISQIRIRINYHKDGNNRNFDEDNIVSNYLDLDYQIHAKMSRISNYKFRKSNIIYFDNNVFHLIPYSYKNLLKKEYFSIKNIFNSKSYGYKYAIILRLSYILTYIPFNKFVKKDKEIYLFEDRVDNADDNGEHLFKYAMTIEDNVKKYFVLSKDSKDYERLSKIGKVLSHGSFKHKILTFHADKIISSHPYESVINPFYDSRKDQRALYAGLLNYKLYFLQHGVTLGNISSWLSKFDKNLSLITTVSLKEKESFLEEGYNYDESIIQTLGFPRYDNLKNNPNKQILIIPSWRRYLRTNKERFLASDYYKDLNSLLNNEKLMEIIREKGYNIVFKAHPELNRTIGNSDERYIDLLKIPDEIYISQNESYQELFNNSSLMITDYSSVFFDFAYLKKPVIYYQKEEDYHYEKSYFDIETMGFGDIIKTEDALIEKIEFYLKENCQMEDKYKNRVEDFFKYKDQKNCKRVYDWIKEN